MTYTKLSFEREVAGGEDPIEDSSLSSTTKRDRPQNTTCNSPDMELNICYVEDKRLQNPKIAECAGGKRSRHDKSNRPSP